MMKYSLSTGVLILLPLLLTSGLSAAENWPGYRGPSGSGRVQAAQLPTEWSAKQNVRWRTELPGKGWSSPVLAGDSIYLTSAIAVDEAAEKPDLELCLLIVDANSGALKKRVRLFTQSGSSAPAIHSKNSHASPSVVFDGQRIFVHFGHQGTACVELDGRIVWRNESLSYSPVHGNGGSPEVVGDKLIFARDGAKISEVTALDKASGEIAWQSKRGVEADKLFSFCTPLVLELAGQTQLILPGANVVQSLDPANGRELWRVRYEGYSVVPKPIFESGLVFVSTSYDRPKLLAIDPTGSGDVTDSHVKWTTASASVPHTPSLVAWQGKVGMISDSGIAAAYDAQTGVELWKKRIGGNFSASPIIRGTHIYMLDEAGVCT
ncbi:MAG: PQQ-binding-like beta-propeller repeat protein, partial [Planctomycetales bacterium]|nr:PQQ-binding-like beta-propeller repeat protein [Planctomycetales bacterium]